MWVIIHPMRSMNSLNIADGVILLKDDSQQNRKSICRY